MKKGAAGAGPLFPLSGRQGVAFVVMFDSSANQVAGTMNFSEGEASMVVGQLRAVTGSGFSVSTFAVTWSQA
jgi:hypothetical protein